MESSNISILMTPRYKNPYQHLLSSYLAPMNVDVDLKTVGVRALFNFKNIQNYDLIHLHWIDPFYQRKSKIESWLAAHAFCRWIKSAHRRLHKPVIATVHNILPHNRRDGSLDKWVHGQVYKECDYLIFHSQDAYNAFCKTYGNMTIKNHAIIPHALYPSSLVPKPSQAEARKYFGIDHEGSCVLYFGSARKQKGFDLLLDAQNELAQADIFLLMTGEDLPLYRSRSILTLPYFIPEEEIPVILATADVMALPYRSCTTSGVATMALGAELPLAVSRIPAFETYVQDGLASYCDFEDRSNLPSAIKNAISIGKKEGFNRAVLDFKHGKTWPEIAKSTYAIYTKALQEQLHFS